MNPKDIDTIARQMANVPVDILQKAALKYAAMRLRETGEKGSGAWAQLLELLAEENVNAHEVLF